MLSIFQEFSLVPVEVALEGLCMLIRAMVSWPERTWEKGSRRTEESVCIGWGLGLRGPGLSFNSSHLLRVILSMQINLFEHHFPPKHEDVELPDVLAQGDGE